MTLLSDLIYAGYRIAGIVARARRNPNAEHQQEGLEIFNRMVGSWNNIQLNIFTEAIQQYNLAANTKSYTIGPGGVFNAARPVKIVRANLFISSSPTVTRRPMNLLDDAQWLAKRVQDVAGPPFDLYDDYASPLSTLYFWPVPDRIYPFEILTWSQIPTATAVSNQIQLPPGYEEAIVFNLAKRMAAQFPEQANMSQEAMKLATSSLSAIQSHNAQSPRARNDAAGLGRRGRGDFNYITGTQN